MASACCRGKQPTVSVDCVILQFTSDTDNIIMSLMSSWVAIAQPLPLLFISLVFLVDAQIISLRLLFLSYMNAIHCCLGSVGDFLCKVKLKLRSGVKGLSLHGQTFGEFFSSKCCFLCFSICVWGISSKHHSGLKLSCVWSNPISIQCLSRSRAGMVQRGWKFQSPLYHFPYHYSIHSHFSLSWVPRGSEAAEKGGHLALGAQL